VGYHVQFPTLEPLQRGEQIVAALRFEVTRDEQQPDGARVDFSTPSRRNLDAAGDQVDASWIYAVVLDQGSSSPIAPGGDRCGV